MEFRWVAVIALWTLLTGPIFNSPTKAAPRSSTVQHAVKTVTVAAHP